jgi:RNA polymerase sigma factor (sigma-70 family)
MTTETEVILLNEPYVHWFAHKYEWRNDHEDILQVARLGVLAAFNAFDPQRCSWSSFAGTAIERRIWAYLKVEKRKKRLCPGIEISLDASLSEDEDSTLGDLTADLRENVEDAVLDAVERETLLSAVKDPRHRLALELRIDGLTLEETGKALGVTRERARQLEMRALQAIRRSRVA